eukprot:1157654-Pelagomonas_calceolata.AAC.1
MADKLACGGALCGSEAVLHPIWLKHVNFRTYIETTSASTEVALGLSALMLKCQILLGGTG